MEEQEIYVAIGPAGFERLVAAFYRRVPGDDILGPMYEHQDLIEAEQRLRDFLVFRFGGPPLYIERRGHPQLRARHLRFPIDASARDRWMKLMAAALQEGALPDEAAHILWAFFDGMSTFLINRTGPSRPPGQAHS